MRITLFIILCITSISYGQRKNDFVKPFQFSVAPGFGSNGYHPGGYVNWISINLTSGYSAANLLFEVGGISNLNTQRTSGLQIATLVNFTGANSFAGLQDKEIATEIRKGFEANLNGLQIAGLGNSVFTNVFGGQLSGGANIAKGALFGLQIAGISNLVYKYSFGVQVSALFNASKQSMDGVQLAAVNYTEGGLAGVQLGLINKAGSIEGKNVPTDFASGFQLGLWNHSKKMNGMQVGLVNVAGKAQGTQVGLINIYRYGNLVNTKDGRAIGLINIGNRVDISLYSTDVFAGNYEIITGKQQNRRILDANKNSYLLNALLFSHGSWKQEMWGLGYGLRKQYWNRSEMPGRTEYYFFGYGVDIQHLNLEPGQFTQDLSLLTRLSIMGGSRIFPKIFGVNWFGALTMNAYVRKNESEKITVLSVHTQKIKETLVDFWPGISVGFLIHG